MEALVPLLTLYLQVLVLNYSLMEVVVMVVVHPEIRDKSSINIKQFCCIFSVPTRSFLRGINFVKVISDLVYFSRRILKLGKQSHHPGPALIRRTRGSTGGVVPRLTIVN